MNSEPNQDEKFDQDLRGEMKDTMFARERSILYTTPKKARGIYVVHFTSSPDAFANKFVVRDTAFGGLCVYKLDDVTRSSSIRACAESIWLGRVALIIEAVSDDVHLLQPAPIDNSFDEYVIRAGAEARVILER